jgi:hypothetical protein
MKIHFMSSEAARHHQEPEYQCSTSTISWCTNCKAQKSSEWHNSTISSVHLACMLQEIEKESECAESRKARQRAKRNAKKNEKKEAKRKDLVRSTAPSPCHSSLHCPAFPKSSLC